MPIHVAIIRRVRAGHEAEFEEALRKFLQESFDHSAVLGATLIVPLPGSDSREFGILRTFRDEQERDAFYSSPLFRSWEEWSRQYTEGDGERRAVHGLEAWFRNTGQPPARWKMAVLTFAGVYPLTSILPPLFGRLLPGWPTLAVNVVVTGLVVVLLTWVIMPLLTRLASSWLRKK